MQFAPIGSAEALRQTMLVAIADQALFGELPAIVRTQAEFADRAASAWKRLSAAAEEIAEITSATLSAYHNVAKILETDRADTHQSALKDVREQVAALVPRDFLISVPVVWRAHLSRFLKAAELRLTKLKNWGPAKDSQLMAQIRPFVLQYRDRIARRPALAQHPEMVQFRWMIEELRVSLFAQELKTSVPISPQRLEKQWTLVRE
jgi:ATP-dependent helicase HrpA